MTTAPADDAVRTRITTTGLADTLFVEAGAGTGKTTQLVGRMVNLVRSGAAQLSELAAITFTEAAAAELRTRLRTALEREAAGASGQAADHCAVALGQLDGAAISTLHAFAKRILDEHALAVGLPPRVTILDEVSSEVARQQWWQRFVDGLHADPQHEALLVRALRCGVALEPRYRGQVTLQAVAAALEQSWDRLDALPANAARSLSPVDFGPFDAACDHLAGLLVHCTDTGDSLYRAIQDRLLPLIAEVRSHQDPERRLQGLHQEWPALGNRGAGGKWQIPVAEAQAAVTGVKAAAAAVRDSAVDGVLSRVLGLMGTAVRDAAEARRREGALQYHDLLVLCRRLLVDDPAVRRALHRRYRLLLLDEFQDTDPLQIELATLIAGTVVDGATHWRDVKVEAGRLFFVGDPKQSIYRFRRADIDLFLAARDVFGGGAALQLSTNFRTVPPVLEWVNRTFTRIMPGEIPHRQPRYQPLTAHRSGAPGADHRPVLLGGPHDSASAAQLREAEAADVAAVITGITEVATSWPVLDHLSGDWRPAELRDITVLVPTRTSLPHLRRALDSAAIPYRFATGTLVYATQEVRDVLDVLRAVDDPSDRLSLVAALRSPLYGCSDGDLFTFSSAGGRWDLQAPAPASLAPDHPVVAALEHLRRLSERRWWLSASQMIGEVLEQRQAFLLAFGQPRPAEVWNRLRFLQDQARSFEDGGGGPTRDFLAWADLQSSGTARVHEPLLPDPSEQVVRVMTVHGAKGLEFPITIVSGMTTKPGAPRPGAKVVWDDTGAPHIKMTADVTTLGYDPHADIEAEMDGHEKLRLLYVACTRARDHLVVSCHHRSGDGSYGATLWTHSHAAPDTWRPPVAAAQQELKADPPAAEAPPVPDRSERTGWIVRREHVLAVAGTPETTSATAVAAALAATPDGAAAWDEPDVGATLDGAGRSGTGAAIGRAVHATLQLVDLGDATGLEEEALRQAEAEGVDASAATVAAMARAAWSSPLVRRAATAVHHKEVYLAAPIGQVVLEGYVDLLVETDDGLVVVDYKTDAVGSEDEIADKVAYYAPQAASYAVALEVVTGQTVAACHFLFCRPDGAIERAVPDLGEVKRRVRQHLATCTGRRAARLPG